MRNFSKALLATLLFVVCVAAVSAAVIGGYLRSDALAYEDAAVRGELAGELDTLVCGASHGYRAFVPAVLDRELGVSSYNLSCFLTTMSGRRALLEKELERNPVETVILELSFNSLSRTRAGDGAEGDIYELARLDNTAEQLEYFRENVLPGECLNVYSELLVRGAQSWYNLLRGIHLGAGNLLTRGYLPLPCNDISVSDETICSYYHSASVYAAPDSANVQELQNILRMCNERNIRVIIITTPVSESFSTRHGGLDEVRGDIGALAAEFECEYYDFNLARNKTELYGDDSAFYDELHLCDSAAQTFSAEVAAVMSAAAAGENVQDYFFSSYAEKEAVLYGLGID